MDTTASSFTLRKNAKRAAEAMIRKGTAPAVDYGIKIRSCPSRRLGWGAQLRGQRQQQLFKNGRALPPGFAGRARRFGGRPRGPIIPGSAAPVKIIPKGAITFAYHRVRRILLRFRAQDRSDLFDKT